MMPPNAMPGNFPPNMFPGPGSMPSPSFGSQMPPASSALPPMMPNMPFPPGSVASPGPMGEPGMPPPYHMAAPAGMMQQSPRFPVPGQGMPSMGPGGMVPPGMMPMGAMRPGFPGDMGKRRFVWLYDRFRNGPRALSARRVRRLVAASNATATGQPRVPGSVR